MTDNACPHSNRFKRLRWIAKRLAEEEDVFMAHKVTVGSWVPDIKDGAPVVVNPSAKEFRKRYAHHYVETEKLQPYWKYGCAKRIYKDMKRDGWGGTLERLEKLVAEVVHGKEAKRA